MKPRGISSGTPGIHSTERRASTQRNAGFPSNACAGFQSMASRVSIQWNGRAREGISRSLFGVIENAVYGQTSCRAQRCVSSRQTTRSNGSSAKTNKKEKKKAHLPHGTMSATRPTTTLLHRSNSSSSKTHTRTHDPCTRTANNLIRKKTAADALALALAPEKHSKHSSGTFLSCMRMFIIPMKFPPCRAARVVDLAMNSSYRLACRRLRRHITTCSCFPGSCFSTSCGAGRQKARRQETNGE